MIEMRDCMSIDHVGHCHCAPTPKGRRWLGACLVPAFVVVAVAAAVALAEIEHAGRSHHSSSTGSTSDGWSDAEAVNGCELAAGTYYCSYGSEEFLRFAKVRNFLEGRGANISDADELKTWLPTLVPRGQRRSVRPQHPGRLEGLLAREALRAAAALQRHAPERHAGLHDAHAVQDVREDDGRLAPRARGRHARGRAVRLGGALPRDGRDDARRRGRARRGHARPLRDQRVRDGGLPAHRRRPGVDAVNSNPASTASPAVEAPAEESARLRPAAHGVPLGRGIQTSLLL